MAYYSSIFTAESNTVGWWGVGGIAYLEEGANVSLQFMK